MPEKTGTGTTSPCHAGSSSFRSPNPASLRSAGYAPYLDLRPATDTELPAITTLVKTMHWLHSHVEKRALDYGIDVLSAEHLAEVRSRTLERVVKVKAAVQDRVTREVTYWDHRASDLQLQAEAGKTPPDESRPGSHARR